MTDEFFGTQIEMLLSNSLRRRAEDRALAAHPDIIPELVTLSAVRVPATTQIAITASGTNASYIGRFLDSVLDEMTLLRKEMIKKSVLGTFQKVTDEVSLRKEQVRALEEKLDAAERQNAPQTRIDSLKSQLARRRNDYLDWVTKAEKLNPPSASQLSLLEFSILQGATPVVDDKQR